MATVLPPKSKRRKLEELKKTQEQNLEIAQEDFPNIVVTLRASDTGEQLGGRLFIPANATPAQLSEIVNQLLGNVCGPLRARY